jgi:HD-like signal output (HDOD) protein
VAGLPPFSPVLDRLLVTLSGESVSVARMSDIIETDIVIAGNVLKLVNSALYGKPGTITSVRRAVWLLGVNRLRNIVFAMSVTRLFNQVRAAQDWSMAKFNRHSVACGLLTECLAQRLPVDCPEAAFVGGLFHDLGQLLVAFALRQEYAEIKALYMSGFGSIIECETEVLGVSHPDLSADALAIWNLPPAVQEAARFHHKPEPEHHTLAKIIRCADDYIDYAGMSLLPPQQPAPEPHEPFAPLGIELASADFMDAFHTDLEALTEMFQ